MGFAPFEGRDVLGSSVKITRAGDGLSDALLVDPVELHHGDEVYLVLRCQVDRVAFDPIKDTDVFSRVHTLRTEEAMIVDRSLVEEHLAGQRDRVQRAKDAGKGQGRLEDQNLIADHELGVHDGNADGPSDFCPRCLDLAAQLAAAEAAEREADAGDEVGKKRRGRKPKAAAE